MTIAWVIGCHGLLGSALSKAIVSEGMSLYEPNEKFHWQDEQQLNRQLEIFVGQFAALVESKGNWQLYWAAGIGTMSSESEMLTGETKALNKFLGLLESQPNLMVSPGCIAFASSAGAIYAGSKDDLITEHSTIAPTTPYAHEKLKQENIIREFVSKHSNMAALHGRISTLYGPGQSEGKRQGLFTEIARRIVRNQPIHIYVPYDTIRDYITAGDAALAMVDAAQSVACKAGSYTKIIASEAPVTIAEIIAAFKRISRRSPRVVTRASTLSAVYARCIQFRSVTIPTRKKMLKTNLLVGVAEVLAAERFSFAKSS